MKKLSTLLLLLAFCIPIITGQVWADGTAAMTLKENSGIYEVNGKELKFEKPFTEQDTLMACLDPIAKAMNITLEKSTDSKNIILKYSSSTIVMNIDSKDAVVDGTKTPMPQAPVLVNGNIMVPLRFVVESFGGEVSVDSKTQEITVTKETTEDNSIKDFSLLLKKTAKETVGDSYYNWSMHMPKDVKIAYRSYNGSYNMFEAVDGSYSFTLLIYDLQTGETFDTVVADELKYASDYTLISQQKLKKNGLDCYKIVYKDIDYIYEERNFIKGNRAYKLYLEIEDADKYKNNKELAALLDSFIPEFKKGNEIEDLSDITEDGYRIYDDKNLKFSIKVPADWQESGNSKKTNQVIFTEPAENELSYSDTLTVSMYSLEAGFTLDKWHARELQYTKDEFNPELVKILKSEDITLNGVRAKKNIYSMKFEENPTYTYSVLIMGKNYRYDIRYVTAKSYEDAAVQKKINAILGSFVFSEPKADEVESLLDPNSIAKPQGIRYVESKDKSFSYEVPINWSKLSDYDDSTVSYSNDDRTISISVTSTKDVTVQEYLDQLEEDFKESVEVPGSSENVERQVIADKGVIIVNYNAEIPNGELTYNIQYRIFSKADTVYEVVMNIWDMRASEKNKKVLSDIWSSLKLK